MKTLHYGLIALLFITPLLFGTVEAWSLALMEIICFFLSAFYLLRKIKTEKSKITIVKPPLLIPALALLGIALFQVIPLPPSILKIISPNAYDIYKNALLSGEPLPWLTLSLYPYATVLEILRFTAYISVYFLTFQLLRDRASIMRLTTAIMITGAVIALIGIFQAIFYNGKLLWFRGFHAGTPFGPYVNRNHFAGLMEMVIPVCISMLILFLPKTRAGYSLRALVSDIFGQKRTNSFILSFTTVIIMITALFLSLSRGGIIGLSVSMLLFGTLLLIRNSTRKNGVMILAIFVIVLFTVGWFGWKPIIDRFEKMKGADASSEYRLNNWKDSADIIMDFPVLGTGFGTYEYIYPKYKTIPVQQKWEHAHNDYIEGAAEFGIPGMLIAVFFIASFYKQMLKTIKQRRSLHPRLLGIGALTGITGMLIHSITDFNLHIGANGLYFSFLLGFAMAVSNARMRENENGTLLGKREINIPPKAGRPLIIGVIAIAMGLSAMPVLSAISDGYYAAAGGSINEGSELLALKGTMLDRAEALNPFDARIPFAIANIDSVTGRKDKTIRNYKRAAALNPVNGEYMQNLGLAYYETGDKETAEKYMKLGLQHDPTSAWMRKNYALWLFSTGEKKAAMAEMQRAIILDPVNTRKLITAMVLSNLSPDEIRDIMPENATALFLYGQYKEDTGALDEALNSYLNTLSLMKRDGSVSPDVYLRITGMYEKKNMLNQALAFYEEGIAENPQSHSLRFGLARLYDRLDIPIRAKEEYERALILSPDNQYAQKRLKELNRR